MYERVAKPMQFIYHWKQPKLNYPKSLQKFTLDNRMMKNYFFVTIFWIFKLKYNPKKT